MERFEECSLKDFGLLLPLFRPCPWPAVPLSTHPAWLSQEGISAQFALLCLPVFIVCYTLCVRPVSSKILKARVVPFLSLCLPGTCQHAELCSCAQSLARHRDDRQGYSWALPSRSSQAGRRDSWASSVAREECTGLQLWQKLRLQRPHSKPTINKGCLKLLECLGHQSCMPKMSEMVRAG